MFVDRMKVIIFLNTAGITESLLSFIKAHTVFEFVAFSFFIVPLKFHL